jgi:membrane-bound inhibitor of C-type lysozyme
MSICQVARGFVGNVAVSVTVVLAIVCSTSARADTPAGSGASAAGAPQQAPNSVAVQTQAAQAPIAPPPGGKMLPLSIPALKVASRSVVTYRCEDGRELGVAYMNTDNQQSFAVMRIDGRHLVFVNVLAGSGARYTADKYVWWSKGPEGNLYDVTKGDDAPPIAKDCKSVSR